MRIIMCAALALCACSSNEHQTEATPREVLIAIGSPPLVAHEFNVRDTWCISYMEAIAAPRERALYRSCVENPYEFFSDLPPHPETWTDATVDPDNEWWNFLQR